MTIFEVCGEDMDFPTSISGVTTTTTGTYGAVPIYRSGHARAALQSAISTNPAQSLPFSIGAATSFWFSFYLCLNSNMSTGDNKTCWLAGVGDPSNIKSGIWAGINDTGQLFVMIGNPTGVVATGVSTVIPFVNGVTVGGRVCVQVSGFGTGSTTAAIYWNSALLATSSTYSTIGYTTSLSVGVAGNTANANWVTASALLNACWMSEFIVADSDIRACGVATLSPTGAGTTDQWSGTYAGVNSITINDSSPISTSTTAQVEEFALSSPPSLPSGSSVLAVKVGARCAASSGSPVSQIQLGFNQGGTLAVGSGQAPAVPFGTLEQVFNINPVTSAAWAVSDLTGLQVAVESET